MARRSFDSPLLRSHAQRSIEHGLRGLEVGEFPFGSWERLHLSAAIDELRMGHFESACEAAERIANTSWNRRPFVGRFSQDKNLAAFRAEFESLKHDKT